MKLIRINRNHQTSVLRECLSPVRSPVKRLKQTIAILNTMQNNHHPHEHRPATIRRHHWSEIALVYHRKSTMSTLVRILLFVHLINTITTTVTVAYQPPTYTGKGAVFQRYISPNVSSHIFLSPNSDPKSSPSTSSLSSLSSSSSSSSSSLSSSSSSTEKESSSTDPYFVSPIINQTVVVGRAATLECDVANLGPDHKVAWLKMDSSNSEPTVLTIGTQTLLSEHKFKVTHNGLKQWFLHIKHVRHSDRGVYMCQVNAQRMISQVGQLDVQVPPIIIESQTSSDTTVEEHHRAVLRCGAKGVPKPKVSWRREDGRDINLGLFGGQKYAAPTADGPELNLTQVTREDMGAYLCIASNGVLPSLSKRILLHVNFRPKIRVHKQMISARVGGSIEIVCTCEASPRPLVTWISPTGIPLSTPGNSTTLEPRPPSSTTVNGQQASKIYPSSSYEVSEEYSGYKTTMILRIHSLSPNDFGSFKCVAKNTLGEKEGLIRVYEDFRSPIAIHKTGKASGGNDSSARANSLKSRKSARRNSNNDNARKVSDNTQRNEVADDDEEESDGGDGDRDIDDNVEQQIVSSSGSKITNKLQLFCVTITVILCNYHLVQILL